MYTYLAEETINLML